VALFILLLVLGLCIGSFLNVCIYRLPRDMSVVKPHRSFCTSCKRQLGSLENIPVLSWVLLGGKCKGCKEKISGRYPLVELLSGAAMLLSFVSFGLTPTALVVYLLTATLIVISLIDFDFKIIPDVINLPGVVIGLLIAVVQHFFQIFTYPVTSGIVDSLIGLLIGGGFFLVIGEVYYRLTKREGIGGGDIKFLAMTGAILGWRSVAPTIFVGSFVGAIVGLLIMFFRGGDRQLEIPFGPYLALGVLIYLFTDLPFFRFPY